MKGAMKEASGEPTRKAFFVTQGHDSFHSSRDHEQRWKHQRVLVLRGWIVCRNAGASVVFFFLA